MKVIILLPLLLTNADYICVCLKKMFKKVWELYIFMVSGKLLCCCEYREDPATTQGKYGDNV